MVNIQIHFFLDRNLGVITKKFLIFENEKQI